MKTWIPALLAVTALWALPDRAFAQCPGCTTDYNNCVRPANTRREICYSSCASQYPPGPQLDSCRDGCQGEYAIRIQGCQVQYNHCINSCPGCQGCSGSAPQCPV